MDSERYARFEFRKKLDEIRNVHGRGTELVSLYVPPGKMIYEVTSLLRSEASESSNIKSNQTRKHVQDAIESMLSRLKCYKASPPNGMALFVGYGDSGKMVAYIIELPGKITLGKVVYRCDSVFYTDPLNELTEKKEEYGLIVLDSSETAIGLLSGKRIITIEVKESMVPNKHGRGGQSQRRFERIRDIEAHKFFKRVAEIAEGAFLGKPLKGILIGGPGPTKEEFVRDEYLHHELRKIIIDTFDTGYTDETGLKELVERASGKLADLELVREKKLVERFTLELARSDRGLAEYGTDRVLNQLRNGAVGLLLLSEELPLEKVEEISKLAERYGTEVELISVETDSGTMLYRTFGGIAAVLRYRT